MIELRKWIKIFARPVRDDYKKSLGKVARFEDGSESRGLRRETIDELYCADVLVSRYCRISYK